MVNTCTLPMTQTAGPPEHEHMYLFILIEIAAVSRAT